MSRLPDSTPVCLVSIPGTHDSATGYGFTGFLGILGGSSYATTQDKNISEQWALGVRAFDFRPAVNSSSKLVLWHGVCQTQESFADALELLHDSLEADPTEFAVIHLRHETDAYNSLNSNSDSKYEEQYESLLQSAMETYPDMFVDFRRDLTVGEMRGKAIVLYRDSYTTVPTGGIMSNWPGDSREWSVQTAVTVQGAGSGLNAKGRVHAQDYSDSSESGGLGYKVAAVDTMLNYSTTHYAYNKMRNVWVFNFASAYSETGTLAGYTLSKSDGYRENASYTNKAIVDYLSTHSGPTGIVLADYVGVDTSNKYSTNGLSLVNAIIDNNFNYLPTEDETVDRGDTLDISDKLGAVDASDGTSGWTTSNIGTSSSQHWSDDPSDSYFEMSSSLWSSATKWTATMTQTLSLPAGIYRLTAAGRSSSGALCTMAMNGSSYDFPAEGDTGGTMDIDGVEWESMDIGKAAGATFCNDGAGRGWRWGSVEAIVTDGTLNIGVTLENTSGSAYQWASIDDFTLEYCGVNKEVLEGVIEYAEEYEHANVGDQPFQIPTSYATALASQVSLAKEVYDEENSTTAEIEEAIRSIEAAEEGFDSAELNHPGDELYNITLLADGFDYDSYPLTFFKDGTTLGDYDMDFKSVADKNYGQAFKFTPADDGTVNGYTISFTGPDGEEHYLTLGTYVGSTVSWSDYQIRTSTVQDSAYVFHVIATDEEGVWEIYNPAVGHSVGCNSNATFYTAENETDYHVSLSLTKADMVEIPLTMTDAKYATIILPFQVDELPDGITAFSCSELEANGSTLVPSYVTTLKANTPYILCGEEGSYGTLSGAGTYYSTYSLTDGLLVGTYENIANVSIGDYVLQNQDGKVAFYIVADDGITLNAYHCYLTVPSDGSVRQFVSFPDLETGITAPEAIEEREQPVYDLSGRRVQSPRQGIYIQGGKKLLVK